MLQPALLQDAEMRILPVGFRDLALGEKQIERREMPAGEMIGAFSRLDVAQRGRPRLHRVAPLL
jgi:hypothetical protein